MFLKDKMITAGRLIVNGMGDGRVPLVVSWSLTERCNLRCKYCGFWQNPSEEKDTDFVLRVIDELYKIGTKRIQFTGGEPVLRKDLRKILKRCNDRRISVNINSNGLLVPEKIEDIKFVDSLSLSLDGPRDIHDFVRGSGVYDRVMDAIESARSHGVKFRFLTVLNAKNLEHIEFMISKAREFNTTVIFQPATIKLLNGFDRNPLAPSTKEYRETIKKLISLKKQGQAVGNSVRALYHLYHWPEGKRIKCVGGRIFCRIDSDGTVKICPRAGSGINLSDKGFTEAFAGLSSKGCDFCWCASNVELSFISSFYPDVLLNAVKFT